MAEIMRFEPGQMVRFTGYTAQDVGDNQGAVGDVGIVRSVTKTAIYEVILVACLGSYERNEVSLFYDNELELVEDPDAQAES